MAATPVAWRAVECPKAAGASGVTYSVKAIESNRTSRGRGAPTGPVPAREITIWILGMAGRPKTSDGRPLSGLLSEDEPRNEPSGPKNSRLKSVLTLEGDSTSRTSTVKSPVALLNPLILIV